MTKFSAVIFDLDGTLIDSIADLTDSMNVVLSGMGYASHDTESYKHMVGDGVRSFVERALPAASRDEKSVERCMNGFREEYVKRWDMKTRPYEGIPEMLDGLSAGQIKMSVLSNKTDHFTKLTIKRFFSGYRFEYVIGASSTLPNKPDPAGALLIARKLGIPPEQFLYLGDTDTDMMTAVSAGMFPVGVLWGFRNEEELREHGATEVIRHPRSLLRFFGSPE